MLRVIGASAVLLSVLALGACSGKSTGDNASTAGPAAAGASPAAAPAAQNAPLYPDWAQAAAPPYPNATIGILVNTGMYQFQSSDDLATIGAWYKSRVSSAWTADATTGALNTKVNGVQISISKMSGAPSDANPAKTMIILSHG